jgi:hypothetical protein
MFVSYFFYIKGWEYIILKNLHHGIHGSLIAAGENDHCIQFGEDDDFLPTPATSAFL